MRLVQRRAAAHNVPPATLCRTCWLQRRQFASSSPSPPKPPPLGIAALPSRRLLSVVGPDAAKFLQGIMTANVVAKHGQPRTEGFYSSFLNATGRVVHDVFVYPFTRGFGNNTGDTGFLIEADVEQLDRLAKYIKRYKLRAKLTMRKLEPGESTVWQAWNDEAGGGWQPSHDNNEGQILLKDPRAPGLGYRILRVGDSSPALDMETSDEAAYTIRRYLQGVPEGQDEILREQALPLESNLDFMGGIDFHKGCYVGQELTIRTKHRGVVRKRILPCMIYAKDKAMPMSLAYHPDTDIDSPPQALSADMIPSETSIGRFEKRGRSAGKWLRGVGNVGLALCRLEIMTDVVLPGETAAAAYAPDDEFLLEWGGEEDNGKNGVKVKAFVPEWVRQGLDAVKR